MEIKKIVITEKYIREIIRLAKSTNIEICGVLLGLIENDTAIVHEVKHAQNVKKSPFKFEIDPLDLYNVIQEAERRHLEIVGIFHSHPSAPYPSESDLEGMSLWPVAWIIINSLDGSYGCYILIDDKIFEVPIILV